MYLKRYVAIILALLISLAGLPAMASEDISLFPVKVKIGDVADFETKTDGENSSDKGDSLPDEEAPSEGENTPDEEEDVPEDGETVPEEDQIPDDSETEPDADEPCEDEETDWFDSLKDGDSYDIGVQMYRWPREDIPSFSMGNGALTGKAVLKKIDDDVYVDVYFQAINMGSTVGHLIDFWYIEDQDKAQDETAVEESLKDLETDKTLPTVDRFLEAYGTKCQYFYKNNDPKKPLDYVRLPINGNGEELVVGLCSDFTAMGRQLCVISFDFDNAIEGVTGKKPERVKQADSPIISPVLSADGESFELSIYMPAASESKNAEIYYMLSGSDSADISQLISDDNKYEGVFMVSREEAEALGGALGSFNIFAIAVMEGFENSVVNMVKLTFKEKPGGGDEGKDDNNNGGGGDYGGEENDQDGRYRVYIALVKSSTSDESMGDVAFSNNRQAIVTISGGQITILIASNPVRIPPYYSGLENVLYQNADGEWQYVNEVSRKMITATDGQDEYDLEYLQMFEMTLANTEDEYVPVKICVPYTPMDSIADGGFIEARLYLDWGSLEEIDGSDELEPDDSEAFGSDSVLDGYEDEDYYEETSLEDEESGIRLEADIGVLPGRTELYARSISGERELADARELLGEKGDMFRLFEVKVTRDYEEVEPTSQVTLYFPKNDDDDENMEVYRLIDGDSFTEGGAVLVEHELSDDKKYYIVRTRYLGKFVIAHTAKAPEKDKEKSAAQRFTDISDSPAKDSIIAAVDMGLFAEITDDVFGPNEPVSRGMFVSALGRLMSGEGEKAAVSPFIDTADGDFFYPYVVWAANHGIVVGTGSQLFTPDRGVSREEIALMLSRLASENKLEIKAGYIPVTDIDKVSPWAVSGVESPVIRLIDLRPDGSFDPSAVATRAEVAVILIRLKEALPSEAEESEEE